MLVLHASLSSLGFQVWAETSGPRPLPKRRGKRSRRDEPPRPPLLPHGADAAGLIEALAAAGVEELSDMREMVAWLPTSEGRAAPSSRLIGPPPGNDVSPTIEPWTVTASSLPPKAIVRLLSEAIGKTLFAPGILVGDDLAFCATALRYGATLVSREQVLPALEQIDGRWIAAWYAHISGPELDRFHALATSAPPSIQCLGVKSDAPPSGGPASSVRALVNTIVDQLVRAESPSSLPAGRSSHHKWIAALHAPSPVVDAPTDELARLHAAIREWRRPLSAISRAPFRLAFRVEEPDADGTEPRWEVQYLLQATADPSLMVPLSLVWNEKKRGRRSKAETELRRALDRISGGTDLRELVLTSLGQAAAISDGVEASLRRKNPSGFELDTDGAFRFLSTDAPMLESAGFGLFVPSWWSRKGRKRTLRARGAIRAPKMKSGSGLSLLQMVEVDWSVALGGETLTMAELEVLAKAKTPLVRLRGQWVQLDASELRAAAEVWKNPDRQTLSLQDAFRMALSGSGAPGGLPVEEIEARGRIKSVLDRLKGKREWEELPPPDGFTGLLRPYQAKGYSWLSFLQEVGFGACLADDMGLGKTVQTLALIQSAWNEESGPVLLACPTSVTGNWEREAGRFTPELPVLVHHGIERKKGAAFRRQAKKQALVITSYSLLHRDLDMLGKVTWKGVILDEAQNIKNASTKQARAARSIDAPMRVALTGTPVENHVGDLWSVMEFLNPGMLGSERSFRERFFLPIQARGDADALESLKRLTGPFILRRLKTDRTVIDDLPEKNEMKVYCTLTREQASLYRAVVTEAEEAIENAEGMSRKGLVLATLTKLKQVCNHPAQLLGDRTATAGRSGKLSRLTEMLDEAVESGDKALVFTQFTEMGEIIQRHLQENLGREVLYLHGGTGRKARDEMIRRFQDGEDLPVFLLSLKAGGTGLNLTRANHVFHFDRWWNPAVENQATDRAFRIGQTKTVQVHKYLCGGTVEEKIDEMIERKSEIANRVVGSGEGWLTELSNDELRDLFALREDAVGE